MPDDAGLLARWADAFAAEAGVPPSGETGRQAVDTLVGEGRLYVWCDPHDEPRARPVSMTARSLPTPNGVRVNWVYTPPEFRRRGYASASVAALSRLLLDSGRRFVFLFTDMDYPTSNKIYRQLGYRHVGDCRHFDFGPGPGPAAG